MVRRFFRPGTVRGLSVGTPRHRRLLTMTAPTPEQIAEGRELVDMIADAWHYDPSEMAREQMGAAIAQTLADAATVERERCAKVAEGCYSHTGSYSVHRDAAKYIAAAIRKETT